MLNCAHNNMVNGFAEEEVEKGIYKILFWLKITFTKLLIRGNDHHQYCY